MKRLLQREHLPGHLNPPNGANRRGSLHLDEIPLTPGHTNATYESLLIGSFGLDEAVSQYSPGTTLGKTQRRTVPRTPTGAEFTVGATGARRHEKSSAGSPVEVEHHDINEPNWNVPQLKRHTRD